MTSSKGTLDLAHRDWLKLFVRSVEAVTAATAGTPKPFWGAKVIYSTIRFIEPGEGPGRLRWYMEDAIALKLEFPDVIAAFDLVGWEDGLHPLSYYMEDLLWFKERQKEAGVDIPYAFHAGETLGDGSKADLVRRYSFSWCLMRSVATDSLVLLFCALSRTCTTLCCSTRSGSGMGSPSLSTLCSWRFARNAKSVSHTLHFESIGVTFP